MGLQREDLKDTIDHVIEIDSFKSKMGSDKENILWLAEDLDYIPVKLTQIESGETNFIAELKELNKKY